LAPLVSGTDAVWVAASLTTIALGWYSFGGAILIAAVAAVVAAFGTAQLLLARHD
jgi:hypothetical protein